VADTPEELAARLLAADRHLRHFHKEEALWSDLGTAIRVAARCWISGADSRYLDPSRQEVVRVLDEAFYKEGCCTWRD
jgi:hypothetical protein